MTNKRKVGFLTVLVVLIFTACGRNGDGAENNAPEQINTIVSIAPSNTEIIMALGLGDRIVAADDNFVAGLNPDLKVLSMW